MGKTARPRPSSNEPPRDEGEPSRRPAGLGPSGHRRDVREILARAETLPPDQLLEVLSVDQWERWLAGDRVPVETYLRHRPGLRSEDRFVDLVYGEFLVREELGEAPTLDEYAGRFPEFEPNLRRQIELHQALVSASTDDPDEEIDEAISHPPAREGRPSGSRRSGQLSPTVDGYEILGELGRGGMGVVYKARQVGLDRLVALKVILAGDHAGPEQLARFRREAESLARVQHPNIIQVYEVGEQDGRPFFALEYVDGQSLAQKYSGTPMPARQAAYLVETLARAVHAANRRGIIHRDLKPANILMTSEGMPKITDFGLAKRLDHTANATRSGDVMGTPGYMAPEQARGRSTLIGPATDVHALGAILYELLAGRPPFLAETPLDTLLLVLNEEPIPPSRWQRDVPRDLETICLKCLRKEPADRYGGADSLAEDLRRFLTDRPVSARRVGPMGRARLWCRRKPTQAALTFSVALLLVIIALGATFAVHRLREELWISYKAQAREGHGSEHPGRRFDALNALARAAALRTSLDLRDEAIAAMASVDIRLVTRRELDGPAITALAFDAPLERYASSDEDGTIRISRAADGRELLRISNPKRPAWVLQFSPDGRYLAGRFHPSGQDAIVPEFAVWDSASGATVFRGVPGRKHGTWAFCRDSRRIALGYLDGSIDVRDLVTGATVERLPPGPAAYSLAFRPDDDRILAASIWETREVRVHDLETGEVLRLPHPYEVRGIAWHPGGKLLAAACSDNDIYIWDVIKRTGRPRSILNGHQAPPRWLAFNRAGDLLASSGWDGTIRLWDPWNGKQRVVSPGYDWPPRFSADDSRLAFGLDRRNIGIWEVAAGHEYRTLWGHEGPGVSPHTIDVSPDGRLLASAGADGVRIWDMEKAGQVASLDVGGCITTLFQGDGKALLVSDQAGVRLWPIDLTLREGDIHARVGAPRTIYEESGARWLSLSRAANLLVVGDPVHQQAVVISLADPAKRIALGPHPDVNKSAISPDARWVATGTWHGASGTKVWDLGTGRLAKDLSGGDAHVAFSPDRRWLVAGTEADYRCWAIDSWEPRWRILRDHASMPGPMAFSADGRTLAIALSNKLARLIDAATGRVLADLTAPDPLPISWMCFGPDATRLAVASGNHAINLWDLRRIRRQLAGMNLDW